MWGLVGQMKLPFLAIDQKLRVALIKRIVVISKRQKSFRKQALIAILQSLGRGMQVNWYLLPDDLREALLKSSKNLLSHTVQSANNDSHSELVANELDDSNHIDVNSARLAGNIAAALGRLKFRWDDEESKSFVKETLLRKLPADNSTMMKSGQAVATTLNGLARMVKSCTALDQETCDMLNQAVVINVPDMHPAENANALWSLAMMRATLFATNQNICDSAASESLCKSTAKNLVLMTNYELVWSLWSLAQLRTPFEDLPKSLQESILQAISSKVAELSRQELGLTLWSLGMTLIFCFFLLIVGRLLYSCHY